MNKPIIKIKNLKYHYPNSKDWVIDNITLNVWPGEWLALIGLNGSGKSTLAKLIDGLLTKNHGQIMVGDLSLDDKHLRSIRSKIGVVFQNPKDQFVGVTVKDEVAFGLENRQIPVKKIKAAVRKSLALVGMSDYYNSLISNLSGGQQQRIAIADVIAVHPQIIILDECTSMLNPQGRKKIMELINELKGRLHLTIIDITHDVSETKYAQRIVVMNQGKIIMNGTPKYVFQHPKQLCQLHLALPQSDVLDNLLRERGLNVPNQHFSEMGMLLWLHQLFLNT